MKGPASVAAGLIGLWIAAILQVSLGPRLAVGLGAPDFFLILLASMGMFFDRRGATLLAFGGGWLFGALAGVNLTIYILSRCVVGFLFGWMVSMGVQRNYLVALIAGGGLTLLAQFILLFLGAHRGAIMPYLAGTLITSMYDGVIAAALFAVMNKVANPRQQDRF